MIRPEEKVEKKKSSQQQKEKPVYCPVCNNEMTYIQACHLRCNTCGTELSCEDKGWFWG